MTATTAVRSRIDAASRSSGSVSTTFMASGWSGYCGLVRRRNGRGEPRVDVVADRPLAIVVGEARVGGGAREPGEVRVAERPCLARRGVDLGEPGAEHRRVVAVQRDRYASVAQHEERDVLDPVVHAGCDVRNRPHPQGAT